MSGYKHRDGADIRVTGQNNNEGKITIFHAIANMIRYLIYKAEQNQHSSSKIKLFQ